MTFARYFNPFAIVTVCGQVVTFADGEGLAMRIEIERSLEPEPDRCSVSIAGLDPDRARAMGASFRTQTSLPLNRVSVQLGYDGIPINAFAGRLEAFSDNDWRGQDMWTHATAGDGADIWDGKILFGAPSTAGFTPQQLFDQIIGHLQRQGVEIVPSKDAKAVIAGANPVAQGPFAASATRTVPDALDALCRTLRCRWFARDGMLHLVRLGLPVPGQAIVIAPMAPGPRLPGVPLMAPVSYGGGGLLECVTFLEPRLVPGGPVAYEGGAFRIEHVVHSADTRGGSPWSSRIVGRAL